MKKVFLKSDWFTGAAIATAVALLSLATSFNQTLENNSYDLGVRLTHAAPSDKIAVIAIDDQSIANPGRWPVPRDLQARVIDQLAQSQAQVIGYSLPLPELQQDPGLVYISQLSTAYATSALRDATDQSLKKDAAEFERILREADEKLNADRLLATSIKQAGNVVLSMTLQVGNAKPVAKLPATFLNASEIGIVKTGKHETISYKANKLLPPLAELAHAANGVGFLSEATAREDGVVRSLPLVAQYEGHALPSLALILAARALNIAPGAIQLHVGQEIRLGKRSLPIDESSHYRPVFYTANKGKTPFSVDSYYDVYSGKISLSKYKDKIVLIGSTAKGADENRVTPVDAAMPPVLVLAHTLSSMLQGQAYRVPAWHAVATIGVYLLVALYLILALPRLRARHAAAISAALVLVLTSIQLLLMTQLMLWVPLVLPLTLLILGHVALSAKRFLIHKKRTLKPAAKSMPPSASASRDLRRHTKPGQLLPLAKSMKIIAKVGAALHHTHAQHVVHRDIKPENILYDPKTGAVKIADASRTQNGMLLDTPAFMSPEQLAGKKIDGRSDMFSLGVTFYQLVTGYLPFKGETGAEVMRQIANAQPQPITDYAPNVPRCVIHIISKMMMKRPEDRHQTGKELAHAIAACGQSIASARKTKT